MLAVAEDKQTIIPLSYSVIVLGVHNIKEELVGDGQKVRVCWVRKQRVI